MSVFEIWFSTMEQAQAASDLLWPFIRGRGLTGTRLDKYSTYFRLMVLNRRSFKYFEREAGRGGTAAEASDSDSEDFTGFLCDFDCTVEFDDNMRERVPTRTVSRQHPVVVFL